MRHRYLIEFIDLTYFQTFPSILLEFYAIQQEEVKVFLPFHYSHESKRYVWL
jgi:hypothetical protein